MLVKPNLFIVGAPKCGTTAWVKYLSTHPDIFFSPIKEPHYFCTDLRTRGITEKEYARLFAGAGDKPVRGVAPTKYLYSKVAAREIARFNPDARIIIFLRDQEDFLLSFHNLNLYLFRDSIEDFAQAWQFSGKRPLETIPKTCREPKLLDYAAMGRFDEQIERYFDAFPAEQIRVFHFRNWVKNPRPTYLEILRFLGLHDDGRTEFPKINEAKYNKRNSLGHFLHHPPPWLGAPFRRLKKLVGMRTLGIGNLLADLNAEKGYRTHSDPRLKEEIRRYYEAGNARVEELICIPAE